MDNATQDKLKARMDEDPYAKKLGMQLVELRPGYARVKMRASSDVHNFLGFVHGGVIFSLLDYAFSAASNSHDESAVAISMSVQFINAPEPEGELTAEAREISKSRKLALYEMTVSGEDGGLVCRSDGRVYRIGKRIT